MHVGKVQGECAVGMRLVMCWVALAALACAGGKYLPVVGVGHINCWRQDKLVMLEMGDARRWQGQVQPQWLHHRRI
jgi:hypothetical protein